MSIVCEHITLRPLEEKDAEALHRFRNDPYIVSVLGGFSTGYSTRDISQWLEYHRTCSDEVMWCIASNDSDECLGHAGLYQIDHRVRKAELALMIGESQRRGKGIGRSVCAAMIDYARAQLNLRRIELSLLGSNAPAEKLYTKLGFVREGVLKDAQYRDGQYQDVVLMALMLE